MPTGNLKLKNRGAEESMDLRNRTKTIVAVALVAAGCLALVIGWPGGKKGTVRNFGKGTDHHCVH